MVTNEFDLAPCLDRVRRHDEEAARAPVEHLYPLVIRIVRSHLPRRQAEEDLAQEVFVKAFETMKSKPGDLTLDMLNVGSKTNGK